MELSQSDRLPGACRRRRAVTARLLQSFERWGYAPVAPPSLERYDLLRRGLSEEDQQRCVRFVAPPDGRLLALRADVTPQIARMLAQRVGGELPEDGVVRVSYAADVVRHPAGPNERAEVQQVGVELVGDGDVEADAELIVLCHEALRALGLRGHRFDVSDPGVATATLDALDPDERLRADVRQMLAHKDRGGLSRLLGDHPNASRVASLCDRFGPPSILAEAHTALPEAAAALSRLSAVVEAVGAAGEVPVSVDLGEVRGDGYYTGMRLRAWAPGVSRPIVRGGRYDDLLARYGVAMPATGLAIDLEALEAALSHQDGGRVGEELAPGHLVAPLASDAAARRRASETARAARAAGHRAWVQPAADERRARALADAAGAQSLTLVDATTQRGFAKHNGQWTEQPSNDGEST